MKFTSLFSMLLIAALATTSVIAETSAPSVSPVPSKSPIDVTVAVPEAPAAAPASAVSKSSASTTQMLVTGVVAAFGTFVVLSLWRRPSRKKLRLELLLLRFICVVQG